MSVAKTAPKIFSIDQIKELLPHRYPFLLIDRVIDVKAGKSIKCLKNVSINEPYFEGHFPTHPIMPGVLIIEAMAQATGVLGSITLGRKPKANQQYVLVGMNKVRFRKQVIPGDQLELHASLIKKRGNMFVFNTEALVEGQRVASAELMCALDVVTLAETEEA